MPTHKQNLNVLKNGVQKRGSRDKPGDFDLDQTLPTRDHYERWTQYYKRQYPKRTQASWADTEILEQAVIAARDTTMGVIDTVTREYITYWMPQIMLFVIAMDEDESANDQTLLLTYKSLADRVRRDVLNVLDRIDCGRDQAAKTLSTILKKKVEDRLGKLFVVFEDQLTDEEKHEYGPRKAEIVPPKHHKASRKLPSTTQDSISEARILDSSLAWGLSNLQTQPRVPSPKKRRYSQTRSSPGPDPADNGQVWDSPQLDLKRQKFDFTFTSTIKYPHKGEFTILSSHKSDGKPFQARDMVDLTEDGDSDDDDEDEDDGTDRNMVRARDGFRGARMSLDSQQDGGQCILM